MKGLHDCTNPKNASPIHPSGCIAITRMRPRKRPRGALQAYRNIGTNGKDFTTEQGRQGEPRMDTNELVVMRAGIVSCGGVKG
ncbi:hypothetical protein SAMN05421881_103823 [Nitrosomonas halophila]|uniref:Uncharacterized protein n=1 Tax=Nitrosomonas halophila TaxID=44576 RepID=A0A1H3KAB4_9PROT|nr:hypothetical protein SAMN05421881_103823 [Nitrosomonas halophila]